MKLFHVFTFNTLAALGYGVGFLAIPATILSWHGITPDPYVILMGRFFGVALLGIGLVTWFARDAEDSKTRDAITDGLAISFIAGFALSLQSTLAGQMNALGWLPVGIYLFLIVGYAFFRFSK